MAKVLPGGLSLAGVEDLKEIHDRALQAFAIARDAGVPIAMGTDSSGTLCPFGEHARELELYVAHGMSCEEALATATSSAAELRAIDDEVGLLTPGRMADVILVDGDPLADIRVLRQPGAITHVIQAGRLIAQRHED